MHPANNASAASKALCMDQGLVRQALRKPDEALIVRC